MSDKIFPNGLITKRRDNAPDFVVVNLSFKVEEFIQFLQEQKSQWVNIDIKNSKGGKMYSELNNWKKEDSQTSNNDSEITIDQVPF